jgi:serine/threonine-protein kinase RsbT
MAVLRTEVLAVRSSEDIIHVRQTVRAWAVELRFSLVEQTKVVTAASEIARNTVIHGGGGTVNLELLNDGPRRGLRLIFEDKGPGIPDIEAAFRDGFTTGAGLGLGLGGARRLSSELHVSSRVGEGTRVTLTRWR